MPRPALPDHDVVLTIRNPQRPGMIGRLLSVIGDMNALVGDIETRFIGRDRLLRDIVLAVYDEAHLEEVIAAIEEHTETEILEVKDPVFDRHAGGKIRTSRTMPIERLEDLRTIYTPGVARVSKAIAADPALARRYTSVSTTVGIFTNGTRVLGLGDIGPLAALPVMEGKAVLYDRFVGLSGVPVLVDETDPEAFVRTVTRIAPTFGGIHLEDIQAPECFAIESALIERLDKPVMHDDQHGTATVTLAAVLSALRHTGLEKENIVCTQVGLGAAGLAIARLLTAYGFDVIGVDPDPSARGRFEALGGRTATDLTQATRAADVLIATTGVVGLVEPAMIREGQIVLALSNPIPEISPEQAVDAGAAFAADGRSVNNALAYPGLFKAALETDARAITNAMKIAAAEAISALAESGELVPSPFHPFVHQRVIEAVKEAAEQPEVSRV